MISQSLKLLVFLWHLSLLCSVFGPLMYTHNIFIKPSFTLPILTDVIFWINSAAAGCCWHCPAFHLQLINLTRVQKLPPLTSPEAEISQQESQKCQSTLCPIIVTFYCAQAKNRSISLSFSRHVFPSWHSLKCTWKLMISLRHFPLMGTNIRAWKLYVTSDVCAKKTMWAEWKGFDNMFMPSIW